MIFVGVGSPNPLFIRQRRYRAAVGRFSKIDVHRRDMNIDLCRSEHPNKSGQSTINSTCMVRDFQPVLVDGRESLAPTIIDGFTNVNTP